jgi:hypothetical protein
MPGASCAEQARAIAVLLAAWESELQLQRSSVPELTRPEVAVVTDAGPASSLEGSPLGASPPAAVLDAGAPSAGPAVPAASPVPVAVVTPTVLPAAARVPAAVERTASIPNPFSLVVGGGPLATVANGQLSFGGVGRAALGRVDSPWLVVFEVSGLGQHSQPLGDGTALWSRFSAGLGGGVRLRWRAFFAEAYALFDGALIQLSRQGFQPDAPATSDLDLGLSAALRLGATLGPLRPWLGFRADFWLRGQEVSAPPLAKAQQLPMMELIPALGLDFELL